MTEPKLSDIRSQLRHSSWSRGQAAIQLVALAGCALLRSAWLLAASATGSFAVLLWLARRAYTPSGRFGWANRVTLLRLGVLLTLTAKPSALPPFGAFGLVWLVLGLDLCDGFLARSRGDASEFGAHFDMETDAQLVLVVTLRLWLVTGLGAWVLIGGVLRYLYVLWVWLWPGSGREAPRSQFARYSFAILMIGLSGGLVLPGPLAQASALGGTLVVSWSFARSGYFSRRTS